MDENRHVIISPVVGIDLGTTYSAVASYGATASKVVQMEEQTPAPPPEDSAYSSPDSEHEQAAPKLWDNCDCRVIQGSARPIVFDNIRRMEEDRHREQERANLMALEVFFKSERERAIQKAARWVGNPSDAEDVTMVAFTSLCTYSSTHVIENLSALFYAILQKKCNTLLSKRYKEKEVREALYKAFADHPDVWDPEEFISMEQMEEWISALPERQQNVLRLHIDGYSDQEIAEKLSMRLGTVKSSLSRAREKIRELIIRQIAVEFLVRAQLSSRRIWHVFKQDENKIKYTHQDARHTNSVWKSILCLAA